MSRVRKIQLVVLTLMVVLIAIVIINFNSGRVQNPAKKPHIKSLSQPIESGGTRMESGVHILYRDGSPYATVHFEEAIQKKDKVFLSSPVMQINGIAGKVTADSAELEGSVVELKGRISLMSSEDDLSVSLTPPAVFKDGIVTGTNTFEVSLGSGKFIGKNYVLRIADNELMGKTYAQFIDSRDGFRVQSETGIANLKKKTLTFVKHVRIKGAEDTDFEGTADAAFLDTGTGRLSLVGRGEIKISPVSTVRFTETTLWRETGRWNGWFPTSLTIRENGRITDIPNASLKNDKLSFPWSIVQSENLFLSTGRGSYSFLDRKLHAMAPRGRHKEIRIRGKDISGRDSGEKARILFPMIHQTGLGWVTGSYGSWKLNGSFAMDGNVYGTTQDRQFLADAALIEKDSTELKNAIVWDENTRSFSSAGIMKLSAKQFSATHHYEMKQLRGKGKSPLNLSSESAMGSTDGPTHFSGNVHTTMEGLTVNAPQSYVYKWGAVFFDADFSGLQVRNGHADLLIVVEKDHVVWMLGNADVTDKDGNRIAGHKLTLSTITGRISVYSGKKKVRIKLTL